jgi:hypothetical protein
MEYRIVQYIQPWEIDDFERQVNQHIKSSYNIKNSKNIIFDVTLNLDMVDWNLSKIPKQYFLNKFKYLKSKLDIYFTTNFDTDSEIKGCTDKRRSVQNKNQNFIIWLDSDLYFSIYTLPYLINAAEIIESDCYILSPQLIRYWDSSWDCLVAERFLSQPYNHRDYFDVYSLDNIISNNEISIQHNNTIKFGGGWFNLFTNSVFKKIPIPIEIGSYGPDDTYISMCAIKKQIPQFILSNIIVSEVGSLHLLDSDYIKPFLSVKINDKEKISDSELFNLIKKFI